MPYIATPTLGNYRKLTNISSGFNGATTTFQLSVPPGGAANYVTPGSTYQLIISVGGVIQEPGVDYTLNVSQIVFTTAPTAGLSFFGILMGDAVNIGAPADGTITTAKLTPGLTVTHALGAASTPSITFTSNTNTGIYSPGTNQVAISTNGTGKLFIDSAGNTSINTSNPVGNASSVYLTVNGSTLGGIALKANDATAGYLQGESTLIRLSSDGAKPITFDTNGFERIRITSAGLVGIGTSSPSELLHVSGSANPSIQLTSPNDTTPKILWASNGTDRLEITSSSVVGATINVRSNQELRFGTNNTERMRLDNSGRLGIGTASPGQALEVAGSGAFTGGVAGQGAIIGRDGGTGGATYGCQTGDVLITTAGATNIRFTTNSSERLRIDSSGRVMVGATTFAGKGLSLQPSGGIISDYNGTITFTHFEVKNNNGSVGSIQSNGSSTAYNTSSDYRLKENVIPVADGITRLKQLNPSRFNFITDPDRTVDGFIAHEVQPVVPEAITGEKDAEDEDGNPIYQGIDQSKMVPLVVAALQEAIAKIEILELEVNDLKALTGLK